MADQEINNQQEAVNEEPDDFFWKDRKHFMWFPFSFTKYCVRKGRIFVDKGFFNTVQDQTLLYRIVDIQLRRSLPQRIFGTGTVALVTKADMTKEILLENIKHPQNVCDELSDLIEKARRERNVVGREFYSAGDQGHGPGPDGMGPDGIDAPEDFDDYDGGGGHPDL